jgi:phosphonate transport system substrate-binding protein
MAIIAGYSTAHPQTNFIKPEAETKAAIKQPFLTIGLIPARNIFQQIERYEPLAGYLTEKIGINIKLKVLTRYGNIIDNFVSSHMDAAFFGSFTYALAHSKLGVEAIARPENMNGSSTYYGLIFIRKDNNIKSVEDMKGKRFVFVDKATTAGYLLPLAYFKEKGIEDYNSFFKETYFTGTHQDAIYDVLNKKADVGAAKNTIFSELAAVDSRIKNELVIIARSPEVPENGLAVRKYLDDAIKHKLKKTLINMHADPGGIKILKKFGAKRFIGTSNDDYAPVYKYVQKIGLNLTTYDYMNE